MTFLNPLDALIPKIPFSFFPDFWVSVTSEARGSVSVGFWGSRQLNLFLGGGPAAGLYRPPPPGNENPASQEKAERKRIAWRARFKFCSPQMGLKPVNAATPRNKCPLINKT